MQKGVHMEERFRKFTVLMTKIRRSIQKIKSEEMAEYNLKSPHVSCLYYLCKEGDLTAKELCDICDEDKASISRSIVQLEERGYVICPSASKKRYRAHITLTDDGKLIAQNIVKKIDNYFDVIGKNLSETDRDTFYRCLFEISESLEKVCKKYDEQ